MALILPDFKDRKCFQLDLCGYIPTEEAREGDELPSIEKPLLSRYNKSGKQVFLGLVLPFPGEMEQKHVHLRLVSADKFGTNPPKTNAKPEQILKILDPLLGRKITVELDGLFRVPQAEVSPLIRSTFVETVADKLQVRMTGGTLSVRGAPLHTVTWKLLGKTGKVEFVLEAGTTSTLDGSYLVEALDMIESAFTVFIVGETRET